MIEFACHKCGRSMKVQDAAAGKRGKCKDCGETVTIPQVAVAVKPAPAIKTAPAVMTAPKPPQVVAKAAEEKVLYHRHPSMFRNRPVLFVLSVILCAAGIGCGHDFAARLITFLYGPAQGVLDHVDAGFQLAPTVFGPKQARLHLRHLCQCKVEAFLRAHGLFDPQVAVIRQRVQPFFIQGLLALYLFAR